MDKKVLGVCLVVGLLGLLSAITGFTAESKKIKQRDVENPDHSLCIYPSNSAHGLGFTAAVALFIAEIIISVVTGCFCCRRGSHSSGCKCAIGVICFILSWIACVLGLFLLLAGAAFSQPRREASSVYFVTGQCYIVGTGVFTFGTIMSIISVFLGIVSYLMSNPGKNNVNEPWRQLPYVPGNEGGIALGQPQAVPPQNAQPPVFVHDNTYAKHQIV